MLLLKWASIRGLFQFNATMWHITWGQMPISEGWHIIPPCSFSPLSPPLPHAAEPEEQKITQQQLAAFLQGLGDPLPLRPLLCVSVLLFAC